LPDPIPGIGAVDSPAVDHRKIGLEPALAAEEQGAVKVLFPEPADLFAGQSPSGEVRSVDLDIHLRNVPTTRCCGHQRSGWCVAHEPSLATTPSLPSF